MRYQKDNHSCGPVSVSNALKCFGKHVSDKKIKFLCGTTEQNGTNEFGIQSALQQLGFEFTIIQKDKFSEALEAVDGYPVIASVLNSTHWAVFCSKIGNRILLIDPSNSEKNMKENGIHSMGNNELSKYWRGSDNKFFAIKVIKP